MNNSFLSVKNSPIHGKGIFTENNICKGEVFYVVPIGKLFSHSVDKCAKVAENTWVCDENVLNLVNHSCDPNAELDISSTQPLLVALRGISSGEEITVDYELTEIGGEKVNCQCGKSNCRGYFLRVN